ncbi:MAG: hypothetical protein ILP17_10285 [Lachnospiraceae bacterium]|nr:hypothetical protein [Lachnospiraceae bacterium]
MKEETDGLDIRFAGNNYSRGDKLESSGLITYIMIKKWKNTDRREIQA